MKKTSEFLPVLLSRHSSLTSKVGKCLMRTVLVMPSNAWRIPEGPTVLLYPAAQTEKRERTDSFRHPQESSNNPLPRMGIIGHCLKFGTSARVELALEVVE